MKCGLVIFAAFLAGLAVGVTVQHYLSPQTQMATTSQLSSTGLYTDEEIGRILQRWTANDPEDGDLLRVVPNGTTAPLVTVFGAIGVDESRLKPLEHGAINHVILLRWQLSPSYKLSFMTGVGNELGFTDPTRPVYGIRIEKLND